MRQEQDRDDQRRDESPGQGRPGRRPRPWGEDAERGPGRRERAERNRDDEAERADRFPRGEPRPANLEAERQHRRQEERQAARDHVAQAGGRREGRREPPLAIEQQEEETAEAPGVNRHQRRHRQREQRVAEARDKKPASEQQSEEARERQQVRRERPQRARRQPAHPSNGDDDAEPGNRSGEGGHPGGGPKRREADQDAHQCRVIRRPEDGTDQIEHGGSPLCWRSNSPYDKEHHVRFCNEQARAECPLPDGRRQMSRNSALATGRTIDRRAARTRRALHEALISLILRQGYEATTIQDIIDAADVGRSTFYAHYTGKEDLLRGGFAALRAELTAAPPDASSRRDGGRDGPLPFTLRMFQHAAGYQQ